MTNAKFVKTIPEKVYVIREVSRYGSAISSPYCSYLWKVGVKSQVYTRKGDLINDGYVEAGAFHSFLNLEDAANHLRMDPFIQDNETTYEIFEAVPGGICGNGKFRQYNAAFSTELTLTRQLVRGVDYEA